jgi:predicted dehydrogenase
MEVRTRKVNLGLIGTGKQASRLSRAVLVCPGAQLVGICGSSSRGAGEFARTLGLREMTIHDSVSGLLDDPAVEAVLIASPDSLHFEQAISAAQGNKQIFVEKPLALSVAHCKKIISSCSQSGVLLAVGYHLRWHAGIARILQDVVTNSLLGVPAKLKIDWHHKVDREMTWRTEGKWWCRSMLTTHCLDIVLALLRPTAGKVKRISGTLSNERWGKADESALLDLVFESGATATISTSLHKDIPLNVLIEGTNGIACGLDLTDQVAKRRVEINGEEIRITYGDVWQEEVSAFVSTLAEKRTWKITVADAQENVRILNYLDQTD